MTLLPDWRMFIELLNGYSVDYLVVGAGAYHGIPRSTGDIDFYIRRSPENADRLIHVLHQFGRGGESIPIPSDIINTISGVTFEEALARACHGRNRRCAGDVSQLAPVHAK